MSVDLTDEKSTLVQVIAWFHQATNHYLSHCWHRSMSPYGISRLQWVKTLRPEQNDIYFLTFPNDAFSLKNSFSPRTVLAIGYCPCLRLCVCPRVCQSVCQSLARPHDNSRPVQARITKFRPKMQKTLVKAPIVFKGNWSWPSRSNLTWKSEFTPFWARLNHNSLPIQARITKFRPEVQNSFVKVCIILGGNWPWPSRSNLT